MTLLRAGKTSICINSLQKSAAFSKEGGNDHLFSLTEAGGRFIVEG
jgi:hypothetical protein